MENRIRDLEVETAKLQSHIESEFDNIEGLINSMRSEIKENHNETKEQIDKLRTILLGNGNVGFDTRIHQLEETQKSWKKYLYAVWTLLVGIVAKLLFFPTK